MKRFGFELVFSSFLVIVVSFVLSFLDIFVRVVTVVFIFFVSSLFSTLVVLVLLELFGGCGSSGVGGSRRFGVVWWISLCYMRFLMKLKVLS